MVFIFELECQGLFYNHLALHENPVSGEGAEVRIGAGGRGGLEAESLLAGWVKKLGVVKDVLGLWDEVLLHTLGAFCHLVRGHANGFYRSALVEKEEIVLSGIRVGENQFDGLAWLDCEAVDGKEQAFRDASDFHDLEVLL